MIIVRINMNVFSEKRKELEQTLLSMNEAMEMNAGCLSYVIYCNIENKKQLIIIEEWETRKALDRHLRSEMFGILLGTNTLLFDPMEILIFTVTNSEGIEAVNSVRKKTTDFSHINRYKI